MDRSRGWVFALGAATLLLALDVQGQAWPIKPVRVVVPFAPGGGADLTARPVAQKLTEQLGQQFVVDNRGGAAGAIGMEIAAKSPPDGYTIMIMSSSYSATPATHKLPVLALTPDVAFEFLGVFNATVFDFLVRGHMPGASVALVWMLTQIPAPPSGLDPRIAEHSRKLSLTSNSVARLFDAEPHPWDPEERYALDVELDALVAHAYGLDLATTAEAVTWTTAIVVVIALVASLL